MWGPAEVGILPACLYVGRVFTIRTLLWPSHNFRDVTLHSAVQCVGDEGFAWSKTLSPEMSPFGFTLAFDILCPSGILSAFTIPLASNAELNTLHEDDLPLCCC